MAQYNISASGNQLIIELIVTDGDFAPSIVSLKTPSIKLTTDRIKFFDSAVYNMALLFDQINEIDGVVPTDLEDAADKIIALIANFNGGGAAPYKVYTALLTQTGTNAPVATVLENTLGGDIIWSYAGVGSYIGTLNESFLENKYFSLCPVLGISAGYDAEVNNGGGGSGYRYARLDDDNIIVNLGGDSALINTPIEIRVYN